MIAVPPAATATTVATVNNGFPRANAVMAMFSLCLLSVPKTPLPNSGPLPPCATQRMDGTFLLRCRNKRRLAAIFPEKSAVTEFVAGTCHRSQ
jgi:hypothetical protein